MLFPAPRLVVLVVGGGPLWNLPQGGAPFQFSQSVQSVQSVQLVWGGLPGDPENSNSYGILKVKSSGPQTCPFPPF